MLSNLPKDLQNIVGKYKKQFEKVEKQMKDATVDARDLYDDTIDALNDAHIGNEGENFIIDTVGELLRQLDNENPFSYQKFGEELAIQEKTNNDKLHKELIDVLKNYYDGEWEDEIEPHYKKEKERLKKKGKKQNGGAKKKGKKQKGGAKKKVVKKKVVKKKPVKKRVKKQTTLLSMFGL